MTEIKCEDESLCMVMEDVDEEEMPVTEIYDNASNVTVIEKLSEDERLLEFNVDKVNYRIDLATIDWFRLVPTQSHMATYFRNNNSYRCEWDERGEVIGNKFDNPELLEGDV